MKKQSVFMRILVPFLIVGIFQSLLVGGAVLMGGTVDLLRENSRRILGQNLQNRQIALENDMIQHWSNLDGCVETIRTETEALLEKTGVTLTELQESREAEKLLELLSDPLLYAMRKNSVTGIFLVLSNGRDHAYPSREEAFQGVYFRDLDPKTNPGDYSDVLMERGPASVAEAYSITLDSLWREEYRFAPPGENGNSMEFYFAPYMAARENLGLDYRNLGRWSEPFLLSGDTGLDADQVITYSVPLLGSSGMPFGVMGVEVSVNRLYEMMPSTEVDAFNRGGYMLVICDDTPGSETLTCVPQVVSGNAMKQISPAGELMRLARQPNGLYRVEGRGGPTLYMGLQALDLYNSNTPFSGQRWALAAVMNEEALYGIADNLQRSVVVTTVASLLISALCIYLVAARVTQPLSRAAQRLRDTGPEGLAEKTSGISEIDELFAVIRDLNRRQKSIEVDLKNERERYLLALESTTDIILEYDCGQDTLLIYHLEKTGGQSRVSANRYPGYRSMVETGGSIHPDDRRKVLDFLEGKAEEVILRSKKAPGSKEYFWFSARGKAVYGDDGCYVRTIGSTRNITAEKEAEIAQREANKRDKLTGLLKQEEGEAGLRAALEKEASGCLALLDLDDFGRLNEQYGMLYCDLMLEAIGATLKKCAGPDDILSRYGGDEFLVYFAHKDREATMETVRQLCRRVAMLSEGQADMRIACSAGFTCVRGGASYGTLVAEASKALAYVKQHNRADAACYNTLAETEGPGWDTMLPGRRRNDHITSLYYDMDDNIVSLAFNLFEKASDVKVAIPMLLSKLARHFNVQRIAVLGADLDFYTSRVDYQWSELGEERFDTRPAHYSPGAYRSLMALYDQDGMLFAGNLEGECRQMLKGKEGVVTLCLPMYDNRRYTGSVIFESAGKVWTRQDTESIREVVKLLSAHIGKSRADLASRAKSEFLSRMSHEIRTPMNAIMGMTNIALCLPELSEKAGECLHKIDASARYLLSLLNDILDMSKIESGKMVLSHQGFDLARLLGDLDTLIRPQAEEKGLRLIFDGAVEDRRLVGDALRLNQILVNLLGNAVKFTGAGGSITVTVDEVLRENGRAGLRFSVKDTGIGIDSRQVARIFNAFEQEESDTAARYGGTGLGLSISSSLVRMMDGKLEVDTAPGKGSDFYFTIFLDIDRSEPAQEESAQPAQGKGRDLTGKRVLLVEDNDLNIEIAREILQMGGMKVAEARNGQEAVEMFAASEPGSFDAILMDIRMPVMDGLEATRRIRRLERPDAATAPIIAMTANAFDDDMRKSIESGMNGHLAKPFEIDRLMELLGELIPQDGIPEED